MMEKVKVLFVCLGNICRSPLAEGIVRHKVVQRQLNLYFEIDSCGTAAYHVGEHPDTRSVANARKNGVHYDHLGRQLKQDDFYHYDLIIPMDESNLRNMRSVSPVNATAEVVKMRTFDPIDEGGDVPDPYYGGESGFQDVFEILERSTEHLLDDLIRKYALR